MEIAEIYGRGVGVKKSGKGRKRKTDRDMFVYVLMDVHDQRSVMHCL